MTDETRALVEVSAALADASISGRAGSGRSSDAVAQPPRAGDASRLEQALERAQGVASPVAIEEALLQSYLFLGYPAALRGLAVWRRLTARPAAATTVDDPALWQERGIATCSRVYGGQYERLRGNIAALHPDMERWMIVEGYGKVLSRAGLDLATRELCVVALLAAQDAAPQVYSHLRGALHAGCTEAEVSDVVRLLTTRLPAERATVLADQWRAVLNRRVHD